MSNSLASELLQQLQGAPLQQIAGQLGLDPSQAQGAIGTALPLLLGALGNNAAQPSGAASLLGALQQDHSHGAGIGDLLGAVLGGGGSAAQPSTNGAGILGHIFGGNQDNAAANLGQATGLGGAQSSQLLAVLAPIVMSFLAQRFLGGGQQADASNLGAALGQEQATHTQSGGLVGDLLGSVLGGGQGGGALGDVLKIGAGLLGGKF